MQPTSKCPVCGCEIELVPKLDDPKRVQGWCNHGDIRFIKQPVIEMDAEPIKAEPVQKVKKEKHVLN